MISPMIIDMITQNEEHFTNHNEMLLMLRLHPDRTWISLGYHLDPASISFGSRIDLSSIV